MIRIVVGVTYTTCVIPWRCTELAHVALTVLVAWQRVIYVSAASGESNNSVTNRCRAGLQTCTDGVEIWSEDITIARCGGRMSQQGGIALATVEGRP